jgi:hypothetical protein
MARVSSFPSDSDSSNGKTSGGRRGIEPLWNLLIGFPGETEKVYRKSVDDLPLLVCTCTRIRVGQAKGLAPEPAHPA